MPAQTASASSIGHMSLPYYLIGGVFGRSFQLSHIILWEEKMYWWHRRCKRVDQHVGQLCILWFQFVCFVMFPFWLFLFFSFSLCCINSNLGILDVVKLVKVHSYGSGYPFLISVCTTNDSKSCEIFLHMYTVWEIILRGKKIQPAHMYVITYKVIVTNFDLCILTDLICLWKWIIPLFVMSNILGNPLVYLCISWVQVSLMKLM